MAMTKDDLRVEHTMINQLVEMLKKCSNQFLFYAAHHAAKGTEEGHAKAKTNIEFAQEINALLYSRNEPRTVFKDQTEFMGACDQHVGCDPSDGIYTGVDHGQLSLYFKLIEEEVGELSNATGLYIHSETDEVVGDSQRDLDVIETVDAGLDIIVVTIGMLASLGVHHDVMQECWDEVIRSNMAKIDPQTGKVTKREDGKVLKPEGWTPPDLRSILLKHGVITDNE
jgi:hypothetical protein